MHSEGTPVASKGPERGRKLGATALFGKAEATPKSVVAHGKARAVSPGFENHCQFKLGSGVPIRSGRWLEVLGSVGLDRLGRVRRDLLHELGELPRLRGQGLERLSGVGGAKLDRLGR